MVAIPLRWRTTDLGIEKTTANLSRLARDYLASIGITDPDADEARATALWFHALAITYSPAWLAENGPAIRADFPRVPLPADRAVLDRAAALGRQLADLLDPDRAVSGVTNGTLRAELRSIGSLRRQDGAAIDADDLTVEARWGMLQRGTVVMPGPGRTSEAADPALAAHPLGAKALDVWLNPQVHLHAVPVAVWEFTIGGYQVIKKWLSYRERAVLGRGLTLDEAQHLTAMVRRIASVLLLAPALDAVYAEAKAAAWMAGPAPEAPAKPIDAYAVLLTALREQGTLSNADAQAATGQHAVGVRLLLQRLIAEGHARVTGQKRGTRYVAT